MKFGQIVKSNRIRMRLTLRECARELGVDCSNFSKVERGISQAPVSEATLNRWADFFGLQGDERQEFMDAASISRNEFPPDISKDENLLAVMPQFLRVARNTPPEWFDALVASIREAHTPSVIQ